MCGIFGFVMKKPLSMFKVFSVLQKLEISKYAGEKQAVGGYGAGIAVLLDDSSIFSEKVGKSESSPACQLADVVKSKLTEARVLVGHVRFPGAEFLDTVKFKEATQPFVENFEPELTIVSAHNGRVENYMGLKEKGKGHVFESEKVGLVDSEVIPHYFGELLNEAKDVDDALYELLCTMKAPNNSGNSVAMFHIDKEDA